MTLLGTKSRAISKNDRIRMHNCQQMPTTITGRESRACHSSRARRDRGPPPGQPQPSRSRHEAAGRTQRCQSRTSEIGRPERLERAPARRPPGRRAGHRAHRVGSTHTVNATAGSAGRASYRHGRPAAVTAVTGPPCSLRCRSARCAAAALRRLYDLRQRGKPTGVSHGRRGHDGRAAQRRRRRHSTAQRKCAVVHTHMCSAFFWRESHLSRGLGGRGEVGGDGDGGYKDAGT